MKQMEFESTVFDWTYFIPFSLCFRSEYGTKQLKSNVNVPNSICFISIFYATKTETCCLISNVCSIFRSVFFKTPEDVPLFQILKRCSTVSKFQRQLRIPKTVNYSTTPNPNMQPVLKAKTPCRECLATIVSTEKPLNSITFSLLKVKPITRRNINLRRRR